MKLFFLLFFLSCLFLSGCSTNYNYPSKNITVYKTNGVNKEYGLLSVRGDSAIVVLDWTESKIKPLPFSHAEVIKKDSITNIIRNGKGISKAGIGAATGLITGIVLGITILNSEPKFIDLRGVDAALTVLITTLGGAIGGWILDITVPSPTIDLSLTSSKDREFLRSISAYPDKEPDEMQYIK